MNIHEYQAKNILKEFGAPVPNGIVILNKNEIENKAKKLNSKILILFFIIKLLIFFSVSIGIPYPKKTRI